MSTLAQNIFEIQNSTGYSIIRFFGDVDAGTVEQIRPVLQTGIPEFCPNIMLDLSKVDFLDSHGVGLFVSLLKRAHKNHGHLYIAASDGQPSAVLGMVGFNGTLVRYFGSAEEATAAIESAIV